jgi:hypothetical protein
MKKLLLLGLLLGSYFANAQGSTCAFATPITTDGTYTVDTVDGTYSNACYTNTETDAGTTLHAVWYAYTPATSGVVTITSALDANATDPTGASNDVTDTKISVFLGACGSLTCYAANDDTDPNVYDYRSTVSFSVSAGVTYYFAWDNYWKADGFDFSVTLEEQDCVQPGLVTLDVTDVTTTSATINFTDAITTAASHDVEYGIAGYTPGTGTTVNTTTSSVSLSGLTASATYDYYIRNNCGDTQSLWEGPISLSLAATLPYANNFDDLDNVLDGFSLTGNWSATNQAPDDTDTVVLYSPTAVDVDNDDYVYFRAIQVSQNEQVTVNFKVSYLNANGDIAYGDLTVGNATSPEAQTVVGDEFNVEGDVTGDFTALSRTWTAPAAGTYYFAIHHTTPGTETTSAGFLLLDTVSVTGVLSTHQVTDNMFSVFPNPANNFITVSNSQNIKVNTISITDMNGRVVKANDYSTQAAGDIQISVSDLSVGMYLMNIKTENGTLIKKIVKN